MTKRIVFSMMSETVKDRLSFLGRMMGVAAREIGEIAILACAELDNAKSAATLGKSKLSPAQIDELMSTGYMDVYAAIGEQTGISRRSISDYITCAKFYPNNVWEKYSILPFSHFRFALGFGNKWSDVLDLSIRQMDNNNGRPPSVEWLEMTLRTIDSPATVKDRMDAEDIVYGDYSNPLEYPADIAPDDSSIAPGTRFALDRLKNILSAVQKITQNLDLPDELGDQLADTIENFIQSVNEICNKVIDKNR